MYGWRVGQKIGLSLAGGLALALVIAGFITQQSFEVLERERDGATQAAIILENQIEEIKKGLHACANEETILITIQTTEFPIKCNRTKLGTNKKK